VGATRAHARGGPSWASGGGDKRAGEREGGKLGLESAQPRGGEIPFSFSISNSISLSLFYNLFFL
jgi:hypothetical protein